MSSSRPFPVGLDLRLLSQGERWIDGYRRRHLIAGMSSDHLRALIRFLERRVAVLGASRHWVDRRELPDPARFPDLLAWLRATPLVSALYDELAARDEPLIPQQPAPTELYVTGTGQRLGGVHPGADCRGSGLRCPIHAPSEHPLRAFPTHWDRNAAALTRVCPHGLVHPDPDVLAHTLRCYGSAIALGAARHRCDGCCGDALAVVFEGDEEE